MNTWGDFPGGPLVKNLPFNAGSSGLIPDLGAKTPHGVAKNINKAIAKI